MEEEWRQRAKAIVVHTSRRKVWSGGCQRIYDILCGQGRQPGRWVTCCYEPSRSPTLWVVVVVVVVVVFVLLIVVGDMLLRAVPFSNQHFLSRPSPFLGQSTASSLRGSKVCKNNLKARNLTHLAHSHHIYDNNGSETKRQ